MALNTLFPRQKELVNYDYFDIAEGVGFVTYYGYAANDTEYGVSTTSSLFSDKMCTYLADESLSTSFVKKFDLDFDLTFNRPKNIKGVIKANIPIGMAATDTNNVESSYYCIVQAVHYDGSTETVMGSGQSVTHTGTMRTSAHSFSSHIAAIQIDVALTRFKKDDTLRFIVEGWFKAASAETEHLIICHDPKNRPWQNGKRPDNVLTELEFANEPAAGGTVTYNNTQMIFHVPFVLDV